MINLNSGVLYPIEEIVNPNPLIVKKQKKRYKDDSNKIIILGGYAE